MAQPNFVLIMTDTQGANVVGCYGHEGLGTDRLDGLARQGAQFNQAYTTCPLCTPARAALFTGIYSNLAGAFANNLPLLDHLPTMGRRFADAGYRTVYTGKWHLDGHDYFGTGRCPPEWEDAYWYDGRLHLATIDPDRLLWRRGLGSIEQLREHQIDAEFTWARGVSDRAIQFLRDRKGQTDPFLLVASFDEPHGPYTCPPEFAEPFADFDYPLGPSAEDDLSDKPAIQRQWSDGKDRQTTYRNPLYFGCNRFVDSEIGRVLDAVDELADENTWVIFTSDHGDMLGAHRLSSKGPAMYQQLVEIPLLIRGPEAQPGSAPGGPVTHADILPTMLDLAGLDRPELLDGKSLRSELSGQEDPDRPVFIEFNRFSSHHDGWGGLFPIRCIVQNRWKLVVNLFDSDELYDLEEDPGEVTNRIYDPQTAVRRKEMFDRLIDWMDQRSDPFRGPIWDHRAWPTGRDRGYGGRRRFQKADGYRPSIYHYGTGREPE